MKDSLPLGYTEWFPSDSGGQKPHKLADNIPSAHRPPRGCSALEAAWHAQYVRRNGGQLVGCKTNDSSQTANLKDGKFYLSVFDLSQPNKSAQVKLTSVSLARVLSWPISLIWLKLPSTLSLMPLIRQWQLSTRSKRNQAALTLG